MIDLEGMVIRERRMDDTTLNTNDTNFDHIPYEKMTIVTWIIIRVKNSIGRITTKEHDTTTPIASMRSIIRNRRTLRWLQDFQLWNRLLIGR